MVETLNKYFGFKANNTNIRTETIAGITIFVTAMYIIVVNPAILSATGLPFNTILTATVILSAFCTIMMGLYANNPILVAPGMGLNAFFTFSVVIGMKLPVETALGAVFWAGVFFFLLSIFNVRTLIVKSIPKQIRYAVAAGIGLFITLIGFAGKKYQLIIAATHKNSEILLAPKLGEMSRRIKESLDSELEVELSDLKGTEIYRDKASRAGLKVIEGIFEIVKIKAQK